MSDCHPDAPETKPELKEGHCIACHKAECSPDTGCGKFCSKECENGWLRGIFSKLSGEDCLEIMARVMTKAEEAEAGKARKWIKAFVAKA